MKVTCTIENSVLPYGFFQSTRMLNQECLSGLCSVNFYFLSILMTCKKYKIECQFFCWHNALFCNQGSPIIKDPQLSRTPNYQGPPIIKDPQLSRTPNYRHLTLIMIKSSTNGRINGRWHLILTPLSMQLRF